jgi:hypothetical protein
MPVHVTRRHSHAGLLCRMWGLHHVHVHLDGRGARRHHHLHLDSTVDRLCMPAVAADFVLVVGLHEDWQAARRRALAHVLLAAGFLHGRLRGVGSCWSVAGSDIRRWQRSMEAV